MNQTIQDVKLHIQIESKIKECDVPGGKCFQDGFELFAYNEKGKPLVPVDSSVTDVDEIEKQKNKTRTYFRNNFTFLGNITGNSTREKRINTTFTLNRKEFRDITFGIKSTGGCGEVIRIKLYYFICKRKYIKSVLLKRTVSPQNGTKIVFGNCSSNSKSISNMEDLKAYCHSNGSWSTEGECSCNEGYEPTDKGCSGMLKR